MEITHFFEALWQLSIAMAPYILFGLLFAGILHELVPDSIVTKHLGKDNVSSVVKSTVFGIPLPVCSCGVIPLATSIKKSGASKGATLSFLISTPITGMDSILATYGIFGWIFTLYRAITSMIIAMVAGILTNIFDREEVAGSKEQISMGMSFASKTPTQTNHSSLFTLHSSLLTLHSRRSLVAQVKEVAVVHQTMRKKVFLSKLPLPMPLVPYLVTSLSHSFGVCFWVHSSQ